jgi:hypothetical protein
MKTVQRFRRAEAGTRAFALCQWERTDRGALRLAWR